MKKKRRGPYTVFWIAGVRDGETLGEFETEKDAVDFARRFFSKHKTEFDPCCGGVGIVDADGTPIEW